jgi:hypothetical protein
VLSDEQRADLTAAVERLAWTTGRATLGLDPADGPDPDGDQREQWLAVLTSLTAIREDADQLAGSVALTAAQHGADYPAIGAAAGLTRQGARRKWPGLAGLAAVRQRKRGWWETWGEQFEECVRAVLEMPAAQGLPWLANLRINLNALDEKSPRKSLDAMLVDACAVALNAPTPDNPADARRLGLLSAITAEAYAALNGHAGLIEQLPKPCAECGSESIVDLLRRDAGFPAVPACREHAVDALREPATRVVTVRQPGVAVSLFVEARG